MTRCWSSGLWLVALLWLQVPWAPFWALVAGALQFIPHFGPLLALFGPAMAMLFSGAPLERWLGLLGAYAAIAIIDGFLLQPYLMHRQNRVPVWASLLTPILLGIVFPSGECCWQVRCWRSSTPIAALQNSNKPRPRSSSFPARAKASFFRRKIVAPRIVAKKRSEETPAQEFKKLSPTGRSTSKTRTARDAG